MVASVTYGIRRKSSLLINTVNLDKIRGKVPKVMETGDRLGI